MAFVKVRNNNNEEQWVPEHWLDHPVLGTGFEKIGPASPIPEAEPSQTPEEGIDYA